MSNTRRSRTLIVTAILLVFAVALGATATGVQIAHPGHIGIILPPAPPPAHNALPPDSGLYTTYSFGGNNGYVSWLVCGATIGSDGCYGSGSMGPFGHAGALIEGNETVSGNTVTRNIYVLDDAVQALVQLHIYKQVITVTSPYAQITVDPVNTLTLPLVGGAQTSSYIAGNDHFLFVGTNRSAVAVRIEKDNLAVTELGGFSPPLTVSSITADKYGFVTVNFGGVGGFSGFYSFDNFGNEVEDGGGNELVAGNRNGISVSSLEATAASQISAARMQVHMKKISVKP